MNLDNPRLKQPLLGKWHVEEFIGSGQYGKVYKVRNDADNVAAIKIISMPNDDVRKACEAQYGSDDELEEFITDLVQKFTNEVESMQKLREFSKNIVEIYDNRAIQSGIYWDVLIVMEYATPLKNYIAANGMNIKQAIQLARDIAAALAVCEHNNIIHRDIKEDNIFIGRDGLYKIGDFGVANMAASQEHHTQGIGTFNYMAPEVHNSLSYDNRADIYSLGIVLYKLFNGGRLPFVSATVRGGEANKKRMSGEALPAPEYASHEIAQMILRCCAYKPEDRYANAVELIRELDALKNSMDAYELAQEIPVKRTRSVQAAPVSPAQREQNEPAQEPNVIDIDSRTSKTIPAWETYNPDVDASKQSKKNQRMDLDDSDVTHGIDMTPRGGNATSGRTEKIEYNQQPQNENTMDMLRALIDEKGANNPVVRKIMEKNKLLENERQQLLRSQRKNKTKKVVISVLAAAVVAALVTVLLVIIFSTSYFANESDYHKIYSRSIVFGEQLFDATQVAYLSEDGGNLYFSELNYDDLENSSLKLCRLNVHTKEKEVICEDACHFDVVIGDYIYFTSGPEGQQYLYRIRKDGKGEKELLLEASCFDLSSSGKTLSFKVLDMNGMEQKIDTTKINQGPAGMPQQ